MTCLKWLIFASVALLIAIISGEIKMSSGTVTRADLSEAVYREIGLSRSESATLVETVIDHISGSLLKGETVKLAGFGTFSLRDKKERIGRNPKTGKEVPITSRRVLVFKPSQIMRDRVDAALTTSKSRN